MFTYWKMSVMLVVAYLLSVDVSSLSYLCSHLITSELLNVYLQKHLISFFRSSVQMISFNLSLSHVSVPAC